MSDFPSVISAIANAGMAIAAIAGAIAAWVGLNTWKKQSVWQTDNELAKKLFLKLRNRNDAFHGLRARLVSAGEMATAKEGSFDPSDRNNLDAAHLAAINKRMLLLQETRREIYPEIVEATAIWDDDIEKISNELSQIENRVIFAHQDVSEARSYTHHTDISREQLKIDRAIAFGDNTDDIAKEYLEKVQEIEALLKEKLHGGQT